VKAGVIAKNRSVAIDGNNGRNDLRDQEEHKRQIKEGFLENNSTFFYLTNKPESNDKNSQEVNKKHFGKLKNLEADRGKEEGGEKEKKDVKLADGFLVKGHRGIIDSLE